MTKITKLPNFYRATREKAKRLRQAIHDIGISEDARVLIDNALYFIIDPAGRASGLYHDKQ